VVIAAVDLALRTNFTRPTKKSQKEPIMCAHRFNWGEAVLKYNDITQACSALVCAVSGLSAVPINDFPRSPTMDRNDLAQFATDNEVGLTYVEKLGHGTYGTVHKVHFHASGDRLILAY